MENDQAASLPVSSSSSSSPRRRPLAESFTPSAKKLPSISRVCTPQGQETFSATDCVFAEKRRQEKPFFLKVFQIRPGSYRFNTIVRIVSQEISSLLSLPASSFSSSSGLPYSCVGRPGENGEKKLGDGIIEGAVEEESSMQRVSTLKLLSEVLVEDETGAVKLILRGPHQHQTCQRADKGDWLLLRNASTSTVGGVLSLEVREEVGGKIQRISREEREGEDQHQEERDPSLFLFKGLPTRGEEEGEEENSTHLCLSSIPLIPLSRPL